MSNWRIDIESMTCHNIYVGDTFKIKYVEEEDAVYYYWESGSRSSWDKCVPQIRDEYLKQRELEVNKILLEDVE